MDQTTRRRAYKLRFEEFGDLRVRVRKPSFRGLELLSRAVRQLGDNLRGEHLDAMVRLKAWGHLFDAFADALIDWDLTDRGVAVPPTRAGVRDQDPDFLLRLAHTWYYRVVLRKERSTEQPAAAGSVPSPEELALLSIPVEVGNDALDTAAREPVEVPA